MIALKTTLNYQFLILHISVVYYFFYVFAFIRLYLLLNF